MNLDKLNFSEVTFKGKAIFFDKKFPFHDYFGHIRKTKKFPFHKTLLDFIDENPGIEIFFTSDITIDGFKRINDNLLINIDAYIKFCKGLQSNTKGRARAFLGQHIKAINILSNEEKAELIKESISEEKIVSIIKAFDEDSQKRIIDALMIMDNKKKNLNPSVSKEEFLSAFAKFLDDEKVQMAFLQTLPQVQIETLRKNKEFVDKNLDKNETFFQNWIDEGNGKYRKQRCLIFGIEFIDPKREGEFMRKRFDILAEQNRQHHILIEMKSPSAKIFKVQEKETTNEGKITEYQLSDDIARAIPQILGYKKWYESARTEEIQAIGIERRKKISKCIIVIGCSEENNEVWMENLEALRNSINIEIWTYTDLIDKLDNTISNLQESL